MNRFGVCVKHAILGGRACFLGFRDIEGFWVVGSGCGVRFGVLEI